MRIAGRDVEEQVVARPLRSEVLPLAVEHPAGAGAEARDPIAHRLDRAGDVLPADRQAGAAQAERRAEQVGLADDGHRVGAVDRGRPDPDEHLVAPRRRSFEFPQRERLDRAVALLDDRPHRAHARRCIPCSDRVASSAVISPRSRRANTSERVSPGSGAAS